MLPSQYYLSWKKKQNPGKSHKKILANPARDWKLSQSSLQWINEANFSRVDRM